MTEHDEPTPDEPVLRPLPVRIARWTLGALVAVVALFGLAHVVVQPVNPEQKAPSEHFGEPCALCHLVLDSAKLVEVE